MVKYLGQNYKLNANRSGFRSPIGWRWVQSFAPINSPSTAFCSIFGSTYTEAWTGQWIINIHTHGAVRWRIQGTTGCHTPHMGIKMIDLAKWHNPPLLSATTMEFPLSGVKHPPLALRRPLDGALSSRLYRRPSTSWCHSHQSSMPRFQPARQGVRSQACCRHRPEWSSAPFVCPRTCLEEPSARCSCVANRERHWVLTVLDPRK